MEKIGIIAGNRRFPLVLCEAAKKKGYHITAVAIKGDTSHALKKTVDKIVWLGLKDFSRMFEVFKAEGITKVVMAGQISPHRLFRKEVLQDPALRGLLASVRDKKADTIFGAIATMLKEVGLELLDSTMFIEELLPAKGTLTRNEPTFLQWEDVYFGFELAKGIGSLDIGQSVAVKEKAVVAVEAMEGTDNLIRRAGRLSRGGFTMVKVSKPKQDKRFDVPVVGLNTIKTLLAAKARCLAIEAGKTLFIDKEKSVELANKRGLAIVAV